MTPLEEALWANEIQRLCLLEAGDDVEAGLAAAEYIVSTQPALSVDAEGHEHKGKGPGGGQFVSKGGGDSGRSKGGTDAPRDRGADAPKERYVTPKGTREKSKHLIDDERIGKDAPPEVHNRATEIAIRKFDRAPKPTEEEKQAALTGIKEKGATGYRRGLMGNTEDRKRNRDYLLREFGDGKVCPCVYCGVYISHGTLEQDKIHTLAEGGRYRRSNLVPACGDCNKRRGNMPFAEAMEKVRVVYVKAIEESRPTGGAEPAGGRDRGQGADLSIGGVRARTGGSNRHAIDSSLSIRGLTPVLGGWYPGRPHNSARGSGIALDHEIHNKRAQTILDKAMAAIEDMVTSARRSLAQALNKHGEDGGQAILRFVDKYRLRLARLLTATQLAALLQGMAEVAVGVSTTPEAATVAIPPPESINRVAFAFDLVEPEDDEPEAVFFTVIEAAVNELATKNVLTREKFDELNAAARAKAFTVAGIDAEETLLKIRDILAENISEGADLEAFRKTVLEALGEGTFLSESHLETVFRTNIQSAFSDGQMVVLRHPLIRSGFPYAAYNAIHDHRARDNHLALEKHGIQGTNIYRIDDPVFQLFRPPWDYNDRCSWVAMTIRQAAEAGINEAQQWLDSGVEPYPPAYVKMPPFRPPDGFTRGLGDAAMSVQLSSRSVFLSGNVQDPEFESKHPRDKRGKFTRGSGVPRKGKGDDRQRSGTRVGTVGRGSQPDVERDTGVGPDMARTPERSSSARDGADRQNTDKPTDTRTSGPAIKRPILSKEEQERTRKIDRRIYGYSAKLREMGREYEADWLDHLRANIRYIGVEKAREALGEGTTTEPPKEKVQYRSAEELDVDEEDIPFIKEYLDKNGIVLQTGTAFDPNLRTISSAPIAETTDYKYKTGDVVPTSISIATKLEESKLLPGLESTEDLDTLVGHKVTNLTPDVITKLDEKYGKDKWIVKSYGDESFAGFGIFFPQRIRKMQRDARTALVGINRKLRQRGYKLERSENNNIIGVSKLDSDGKVIKFNTRNVSHIRDKTVRRLTRMAARWAPSEHGVLLPMSSDEQLHREYGIKIRWTPKGRALGITFKDGENVDFNTEKYYNLLNTDGYDAGWAYLIDRALAWGGKPPDVGFMAQPAFQAVGATEKQRAEGWTYEVSTEGRVHIVAKDGKVSVVPYATLASRQDAIPVIIPNDDVRAMEKAAQDAINALPESERTNHVYGPDVIKTTEGWRVIETNSSTETGSSGWLEVNPLVIDAYVSHILGRDPAHVHFMRGLLQDKIGKTTMPDVITVPKSGKPSAYQ